jgi:hypothetical protein
MYALAVVRLQMYALRREQGRAAEMEEALLELEADFGIWAWMRAVVAHLYAELGRTSDARRVFEECAAGGFENWPLDNDWLLGLTLFADVCTFLGDAYQAAQLYELLSPYESRNGFGHPEFSTGSVARSLANLASTMKRFDHADRHFQTALESNVRMGAWPWVAHGRLVGQPTRQPPRASRSSTPPSSPPSTPPSEPPEPSSGGGVVPVVVVVVEPGPMGGSPPAGFVVGGVDGLGEAPSPGPTVVGELCRSTGAPVLDAAVPEA